MKVNYRVKIGRQRFSKVLCVGAIPQIGWSLRISNNCFVVKEIEQDLTAYEENAFGYTESVEVVPDDRFYKEEDFIKIIDDITKEGWKEIKPRKKIVADNK